MAQLGAQTGAARQFMAERENHVARADDTINMSSDYPHLLDAIQKQQQAGDDVEKLAGFFKLLGHCTSELASWGLALAATIALGLGEVPTAGLDTPATIIALAALIKESGSLIACLGEHGEDLDDIAQVSREAEELKSRLEHEQESQGE